MGGVNLCTQLYISYIWDDPKVNESPFVPVFNGAVCNSASLYVGNTKETP